ncbi:MAG: lipid-A-disaccharide synthase [Thioalkalispiraceae bacterium]
MSSNLPSSSQRIMIVAGEASGDHHAAKLVTRVKKQKPELQFYGIGGAHMREAGVDILVDSADMAVVGLVEVLAHRKVIFGALNQMRELLRTDPPDLLILTDYPDFNLRLAKTARQCGVKVLYYISPQVWAWRQGRVKKIRERVDMMAVVFPFEVDFYKKHDVPVKFVGHPLLDEVAPSRPRLELLEEFSLDANNPIVGLFPGSRKSEIKRLLPIILDSAQALRESNPNIQFVLPIASTLKTENISDQINETLLDIKVIEQRPYDAIEVCDTVISVSGTVTLEIALLEKPMVIINKIAWLSYIIVKQLLKIDNIGLCNIIAGMDIVPELIQKDATPEKISHEVSKILNDKEYAANMRRDLSRIKSLLKGDNASKLESVVLEVLEQD